MRLTLYVRTHTLRSENSRAGRLGKLDTYCTWPTSCFKVSVCSLAGSLVSWLAGHSSRGCLHLFPARIVLGAGVADVDIALDKVTRTASVWNFIGEDDAKGPL